MTIDRPVFGEPVAPTRQARSTATRARILDAAAEEFTEKGIGAVSLRDVAARAGLTHPGLLRHFPSTAALLGAVVDRLDRENTAWIDQEPPTAESLGFAALARRNAAAPGYLELYTALSGEATSASHPAHTHMRERYHRVRTDIAERLEDAPIRSGLDPEMQASLLIAAWDGLQLQQRYSPEIDLVAALARHERWLLGTPDPVDPHELAALAENVAQTIVVDPEATTGRAGDALSDEARARRAQIVQSAIELFARDGYHGTSLRDIAARAGISKSTLLYHVASKDELLTDVLRLRDRLTITGAAESLPTARDRLLALADRADLTAQRDPGLVELYAVLSCEGATPAHPAHAYFARRFREGRRYFLSLFRTLRDEGALRPDRDPRHEAAWLIASWDGLQMQWLYDPAIDVGARLRAHFDTLLVPPAQAAAQAATQAEETTRSSASP